MGNKPGVMIYFDVIEPLNLLTDSERGQLFTAILEYGKRGTVPTFDGTLAVAWGFIRPKLDMDGERYSKSTMQKQYAAYCKKIKGSDGRKVTYEEWMMLSDNERERLLPSVIGRKPSTTPSPSPSPSTSTPPTTTPNTSPSPKEIKKADKPPTRHKFTPPSVEEVRAYCKEKGYADYAERFVDYYTSNGWRVGKNPMRDWKAAVRTWNKNDKEKNNGRQGKSGENAVSQYGKIGTRL